MIVENLPVPVDRRVWQEATTLKNAGYDVSVICPTGKGCWKRHEVIEGIHVYRHPLPLDAARAHDYVIEYGAALYWEFTLAWKVFFTRGFDAIHACNPPDLIVFIAMVFKLFGRKFLFDHHDVNPELFEAKFKRRGFTYACIKLLEKLTFTVADVSIATNESFKQVAIERGGMRPDRVFVVRSGPDLDRLPTTAAQCETHSNIVTVGYVGIMGDQDGVDGVIRVAQRIKHEHALTGVQFLLIGDGTERARLEDYAKELDVSDTITFTGYLSGAALIDALSSIDIGIVPDPKNDYNDKCTMNKIMEYMALGKPLVQYDLTEGRVSAGDASLYATPNDEEDLTRQVIQLIDAPELRAELGKRGRARIEQSLAWSYEAPKLLQAYDTLFAQ